MQYLQTLLQASVHEVQYEPLLLQKVAHIGMSGIQLRNYELE